MILVVRVCIYTSSTDSNDIRHSRIHIDIHTCRTIEYTIVSRALRDTDGAIVNPDLQGDHSIICVVCTRRTSIDHYCILIGVRVWCPNKYRLQRAEVVSPIAHNNVLFLKKQPQRRNAVPKQSYWWSSTNTQSFCRLAKQIYIQIYIYIRRPVKILSKYIQNWTTTTTQLGIFCFFLSPRPHPTRSSNFILGFIWKETLDIPFHLFIYTESFSGRMMMMMMMTRLKFHPASTSHLQEL